MSSDGDERPSHYILHREKHGEFAVWWRPNRCGYTSDLNQAGLYTLSDAQSIARMRGDDFPVPENLNGLFVSRVVSYGMSDNAAVLKGFKSLPAPPVVAPKGETR